MCFIAAAAVTAAVAAETVEFRVLPDRADCHYALGEKSTLKVTAVGTKGVPTRHGNPVRDLNGVYRGIPAFRGSVYKSQFLDHIFYDPVAIEMNRFDMDFSLEACSLSDHHPIIGDFNIR